MPIIMPSPRNGKVPQIHESVFIAPTAVIIGEVKIGKGSNIWYGAILRGDWGPLSIGNNTSIQENVTIHTEIDKSVIIGDDCIIGHHAMIHGPVEIGNGCLIGIGANVLHRTKLGDGCTVGAGAVVLHKEFPPRCLIVGIPGTIKKELPDTGQLVGEKTSKEYTENGAEFKKFFEQNPKYGKF